ncbi:hypothetical protein IDJ75_20150 [Mucilaginibacter rigui]|uniref:SMODS and SLOG-associating 2TM effector domain-containing protein n=1 Tax=Mucilaginibacter rigui TaxID=534635 RepID=A0ABR7XAJ6_9SPHI|nr:hypothetical protein [Mucilaginibacter rigui]MBD1387608.1 hypothetical protein [Mucilaginibacter rigui]
MNKKDNQQSEILSRLWDGANYQDNLLQSYRNFHLTIQSILIALGAYVSLSTLTIEDDKKLILALFILIAISALAFYSLKVMGNLIRARGEDVNHFQNRIIEHEKALPKDQQILTAFKVYQKNVREQDKKHPELFNFEEYWANFNINEEVRKHLIEKGKGHTRKILDVYLFNAFRTVWIVFYIVIILTIAINNYSF